LGWAEKGCGAVSIGEGWAGKAGNLTRGNGGSEKREGEKKSSSDNRSHKSRKHKNNKRKGSRNE